MPADFERCQAAGGKMITKTLPNGKYIHLCKLGKKWHKGEVKTKKKE